MEGERKTNRQYWDQYVADLEYDVHGCQHTAYKIIIESDQKNIQYT